MRRFAIMSGLLGIAGCLGCAANAQSDGAALVHRAAHCLTTKGFLANTRAKELAFGYFLDTKSYPDKTMLYIVNYSSHSRPDGFVFTIFLSEHDGRQNFNIQNNARFALSKDGDGGVSFVTPPLGGTWTQEHLISAIKEIEKQPRLAISVKNLPIIDSSFSCEAYTDSSRK